MTHRFRSTTMLAVLAGLVLSTLPSIHHSSADTARSTASCRATGSGGNSNADSAQRYALEQGFARGR